MDIYTCLLFIFYVLMFPCNIFSCVFLKLTYFHFSGPISQSYARSSQALVIRRSSEKHPLVAWKPCYTSEVRERTNELWGELWNRSCVSPSSCSPTVPFYFFTSSFLYFFFIYFYYHHSRYYFPHFGVFLIFSSYSTHTTLSLYSLYSLQARCLLLLVSPCRNTF